VASAGTKGDDVLRFETQISIGKTHEREKAHKNICMRTRAFPIVVGIQVNTAFTEAVGALQRDRVSKEADAK
jgi:hypothetical protein